MNLNLKLLLIFTLCYVNFGQFYFAANEGYAYVSNTTMSQLWNWWDQNALRNTAGGVSGNSMQQIHMQCLVDWRNTTTNPGCYAGWQANGLTGTYPCNSYMAETLLFIVNDYCDQDIYDVGCSDYNTTIPTNQQNVVYPNVSVVTPNSLNVSCLDRNLSVSNYTTFFPGVLFTDTLQQIITLDILYLQQVWTCVSEFPSIVQGTQLASDVYNEFFGPLAALIVKGGYGDLSTPQALNNWFTQATGPGWSHNVTGGNISAQDTLFADFWSTWGTSVC
jgi:hypothetical protein